MHPGTRGWIHRRRQQQNFRHPRPTSVGGAGCGDYPDGDPDTFIDALSFADPLFQHLNLSMAQAAAANRVRFADPFPVFNPQGDLTAEVQALCTFTLLCRDNDSHPSDAGYRALAGVIFDASDYIQLQ